MFHYLISPIRSFNPILIVAAVLPAVLLMLFVYHRDRLEKESPALLWSLIKAGVISALLSLVGERLLSWMLSLRVDPESELYNVILYFGIVAFVEEGTKFFMLRLRTWTSTEFNCLFDGVVYAVFVSLGFALWENISYVLSFGLIAAVARAVTAIPGHACFGVFMGVFYAAARREDNAGRTGRARTCQLLSLLVPALLHGTYDYIATSERIGSSWYFVGFILVMFIVSFILTARLSKRDRYIV